MKNILHDLTRPYPSIHSVAEIANWKTNDMLRQEGWNVLKEKLYRSQQDIISFLDQQQDDYLLKVDGKENHSYLYYIEGLIQHDMYHLGQIGLVIKMLSTA